MLYLYVIVVNTNILIIHMELNAFYSVLSRNSDAKSIVYGYNHLNPADAASIGTILTWKSSRCSHQPDSDVHIHSYQIWPSFHECITQNVKCSLQCKKMNSPMRIKSVGADGTAPVIIIKMTAYLVQQNSMSIWVIIYFRHNKPNLTNPQCTCSMYHNSPSRTKMCTLLFWKNGALWHMGLVHYGIYATGLFVS